MEAKTGIQDILSRLNVQQRKAAEAIEGPVQVIAGPGTGKTQILASRIANILSKTDTDPWNILCLTFTEAGVVAMRDRLLGLIGPTAHKVQIHTFHSLCNMIIQEHKQYFGTARLSPIDEVESEKVMAEICETIAPDTPLYNNFDPYLYKFSLAQAFKTFKQENWSSEEIKHRVKELLSALKDDESMYYKRDGKGFKKGDFKEKEYARAAKGLNKLTQASDLFLVYKDKLDQLQRYDFADMILWVLQALDQHEELLSFYQEQFLYLLTDEFQDTNGAQFALVSRLMDHWESPNVFSVGDDDQSIYAFQGANVENMLGFGKSFNKGLQEFVLTENYRSQSAILAAAAALISNNTERLIHHRPHLTKNLEARRPGTGAVRIAECNTPLHEAAWLAEEIEGKIKGGVAPRDIAILYNKHKYCEKLVRVLQQKDIAVNLHRTESVFRNTYIDFIVRILSYVNEELKMPFSAEHELFKILHAPFFRISSLTLAEKAFELRNRNRRNTFFWRKALHEGEATLFDSAPIKTAIQLIENWIEYAANHSPISLLDKVIRDAGVLKVFGKPGKHHADINALDILFQFIRGRNEKFPDYTLSQCLEELYLLRDTHGISVVNRLNSDEGVNFVTIHSSKGLEFKHVYVLANTKENWDSNRGGVSKLSLRPLFTAQNERQASEEEKRRLMYVAVTRAEESLTLTYFKENDSGKATSESSYLSEIRSCPEVEVIRAVLPEDRVQDIGMGLLSQQEIHIELPKPAYIEQLLQNYSLSTTHLNKYLDCPVAFYYENLLRVPSARSEAACIGTAVHDALRDLFTAFSNTGSMPGVALLLSQFERKMRDQYIYFSASTFEYKLISGKNNLKAYYESNVERWKTEKYISVERAFRVNLGGTPINGKLDKLIFDGNHVQVVDYKTGNPANAKKKIAPPQEGYEGDNLTKKYGGDYWRQLIFYYFLISEYEEKPWRMTSGAVSCIEKDRNTGVVVEDLKLIPAPEDMAFVEKLIHQTYGNIMNAAFDKGCNKIGDTWQDCQWCTLHSKLKA